MNYDAKKLNEKAELLKVLAHPVRLCIVKGLLENGGCNVTYMQNCLNAPQSTVSQHLQKLKVNCKLNLNNYNQETHSIA